MCGCFERERCLAYECSSIIPGFGGTSVYNDSVVVTTELELSKHSEELTNELDSIHVVIYQL